MIRVNGLSTINYISRPAFRADETKQEISNTEQNVSMKGAEALASYNLSILKHPEKLDNIEPLELIFNPQDEIEGERIYTSEGKLRAIVKEDENTKTVYTPDEENENLIASAEVIDKNTLQVVLKQENDIENGKYSDYIFISKYSNGKFIQNSTYKNGVLDSSSMTKMVKNNQELYIIKDIAAEEYYISLDNNKTNSGLYAVFDKDKQIKSYGEYQNINSAKKVETDVNFYNGSIISIDKREFTTIPNQLGREKLNNPELLPTPKYKHEIDLKGQKGEISYYSNGAIEKNVIKDGEITAYFDINGRLEKVIEGNKEFKFIPDDGEEIIEFLGDDKKRTTRYYQDGSGYVEIKSKDNYAEIDFDENKKPCRYYEGSSYANDEYRRNLALRFNNKGMLTDAY